MPEKADQYQVRLDVLRKEIQDKKLSGYILPRTDEYQGEFLAEYAERLQWLTGFSGSAGAAIILEDTAIVLSDSRYTIQLTQQVPPDLYQTGDIVDVTVGDWILENAPSGARIGYDYWLFTPKQIEKIAEKISGHDISLVGGTDILIDRVWSDQPDTPCSVVTIFPDDVAGVTSAEKRSMIASLVKSEGCDALLLTSLDSICWLLNVRGGDVPYSPLVLSYAVLYADGSIDWCVDPNKISLDIVGHIGDVVNIVDFDHIRGLSLGRVWLDRSTAPAWFERVFSDIYDSGDPCHRHKSIKTPQEQNAIKEAHLQDGAAMVKFLKWLDEEAASEGLTEVSVEESLEEFRRECPDYLGASFPTISGYGSNGAIVHYRASKETNKVIEQGSLLLVDSGGQYRWGTTDITRTVAIGTPTAEMVENYTRVLKGHIAIDRAVFDKGSVGKDIDHLARAALREVGLDYGHGTGHGVGCYLCVHEDAAHISPRGEVVFESGMLISNEPGYYKEGEYGIRIENLVLVKEQGGKLGFDSVTYAPYDCRLIDRSLLNGVEIDWLDTYNLKIVEVLHPYLSEEEQAWLVGKCQY